MTRGMSYALLLASTSTMDNINRFHTIRFLQWNARELGAKKGDLAQISKHYDILAIQKTWFNPEFYFSFPGFNIHRKGSTRKNSSGLCLLIRSGIQFTVESNLFCLDGLLHTTGIRIITSKGLLVVVSLYKNPIFNIKYKHWIQIFASINNTDNIIIMGDFNAHNPSWGCSTTNSARQSLEKATSDCHLYIINNGSPTRITSLSQNLSAIDFTLVNPDLLPNCTWMVPEDALDSDHYPIETIINLSIKINTRLLHRIDSASTNWSDFKKFLILQEDTILNRINDPSYRPDEQLTYLSSLLVDAANSTKSQQPPNNTLRTSKAPPP